MASSSKEHRINLHIAGMHCASCELLLERKLKAVPGVKAIDANYRTGIVRVISAGRLPAKDLLASAVHDAGYSLADEDAPTVTSVAPDRRKWMEIGASLVVILALGKLLEVFNVVSIAPSTSGPLSLGGIFLIGIVAGMSSCLAVTGGLLLALAAKHNELRRAETPWEHFQPLLRFNAGRLTSYFVLGGLVGLLGQSITLSTRLTGWLNILVALVMIGLALSILQIVPKGSFPIRPPKRLSHWIAGLSDSEHPAAPFVLGALTFFLPCGFTQSLQLVALASGNFMTGAAVMFTFALGTLPSLLGLSAISSTATGGFSRLFLRFSGTLVLLLALFNLNSGFALMGIDTDTLLQRPPPVAGSAAVTNGVQTVSMTVTPYGVYEPSRFTIRAGLPVRWVIDGSARMGCLQFLTIPALGITRDLKPGTNVIEFTAPESPGTLAFSCSMGMARGSFTII
jgi:uncharacterized protein